MSAAGPSQGANDSPSGGSAAAALIHDAASVGVQQSMRTRVKICGITRPADGVAAARAGADAIGLVFWPGTPRRVPLSLAREIAAALPPMIAVVALFVDPTHAEVQAALDALPLAALQFHG